MEPTATQGPYQAHGTTRAPPRLFNSVLTPVTRFTADDPFVDPPPGAQPIPYLPYPTGEPSEYVAIPSPYYDTDGVNP